METEKKKKNEVYRNDYNRQNYKRYGLMISKNEKEIIEKLESVKSKNAYIIELIRNDLKK